MDRQHGLWVATGDGYYVLSLGIYVVLGLVAFAGVSWGFAEGESADKIFGIGSVMVVAIVGLATAYFWFVGMVLSRGVNSVYVALVLSLTLVGVLFVMFLLPAIASRVGGSEQD